MISDYLVAESAIVQRLRNTMAGVEVMTSGDITVQDGRVTKTPYVRVLYGGDRITSQAGRGEALFLTQRWLVVLVVRDGGSRQDAGSMLLDIMQALSGWQPVPDTGRMVRADSPEPEYGDGLAHFPLAFDLPIPIRI